MGTTLTSCEPCYHIGVYSVPDDLSPAKRAQWLAELTEALDEARQLLVQLEVAADYRETARELYLKIEAARLEVQLLRLSRSLQPRGDFDPEWTQLPPWIGWEASG
jgi:acyl-CoA reductase-like NAD-dependent aldehyde dehydrogenase